MKNLLIAFLALLPLQLCAVEPDSIALSRPYYWQAKSEIAGMLEGSRLLSYERAIFVVENAFRGNSRDYEDFCRDLDAHTENIRLLIRLNRQRISKPYNPTPMERIIQSQEKRKIALESVLANWAIYSYMRDTILPVKRENGLSLIHTRPFTYSFGDPLGSADWSHTLVSNLLETNSGNCFALASLFRIFAERLNTDAMLSTVPGHIFIRHADETGELYNVELSNGLFPGSGSIETITYTTGTAVNNNIAMRNLDGKQSVALCLVYLAKGFEHSVQSKDDPFILDCAETALQYDPLNLNAMLLKREWLEHRLLTSGKQPKELKQDSTFQAYETLTAHLYELGYREMPLEMKNLLVKGWKRDSSIILLHTNHNPGKEYKPGVPNTRYTSLSWGLFDEEIPNKPVERYGRALFDTRSKQITAWTKEEHLYNDYNFDPVVFAWNVDPMAHKFPHASPYNFVEGNPISRIDPDGNEWVNAWDAEVSRLGKLALEKPNSKQTQRALKYAQSMQKDVNDVVKAIHDNDPALYDYVQNLSVTVFNKKLDVKVEVDISYRVTGSEGEGGVTNYFLSKTETAEHNGETIRVPYSQMSVSPSENRPTRGFSITLYGANPSTLANEIGDVMFVMEYNNQAAQSGTDARKSWPAYMRIGGPGNYSSNVEKQYERHVKQTNANPKSKKTRPNPYPLNNQTR